MPRPWGAFCALILSCLPGIALPGAWPREAGTVFVSFSQELTDSRGRSNSPEAGHSSLYAEIGFENRLTLGLDTGRNNHFKDWKLLVFLRRPLDDGTGVNRYAVELGLGKGSGDDSGPRIHTGLSWGRGLTTRWGPGWSGIEGSYEWRPDNGKRVWKADLTLGIKPSDRHIWMMQVQSGDYPGASPYLRLSPSYVRRIGRGETRLQLGLSYDLTGHPTHGIKLGSWMSF